MHFLFSFWLGIYKKDLDKNNEAYKKIAPWFYLLFFFSAFSFARTGFKNFPKGAGAMGDACAACLSGRPSEIVDRLSTIF